LDLRAAPRGSLVGHDDDVRSLEYFVDVGIGAAGALVGASIIVFGIRS
jgi:hypothetical protein